MESVSLRLYSDTYPCGTGKHPNINVETQIPLELYFDMPLKILFCGPIMQCATLSIIVKQTITLTIILNLFNPLHLLDSHFILVMFINFNFIFKRLNIHHDSFSLNEKLPRMRGHHLNFPAL